jgi:hypothetical protein
LETTAIYLLFLRLGSQSYSRKFLDKTVEMRDTLFIVIDYVKLY